jgi:DNA-directed RNA polymerase subunit H (RpoH/RPB5)
MYSNIDIFYEYRRSISLDNKMTDTDINKEMLKNKYLILKSVENKYITNEMSIDNIKEYLNSYDEKSLDINLYITFIIIVYPGTECESKRASMIKLLNHIRYPKCEVLIITYTKLSSSINKYISELTNTYEHKNQIFKSYTYNLLKTIVPNYITAPKYNILTTEEIENLNKNNINTNMIPRMLDIDPQVIWIGAKVGDILRYEYASEISIKGIEYAIVIPSV